VPAGFMRTRDGQPLVEPHGAISETGDRALLWSTRGRHTGSRLPHTPTVGHEHAPSAATCSFAHGSEWLHCALVKVKTLLWRCPEVLDPDRPWSEGQWSWVLLTFRRSPVSDSPSSPGSGDSAVPLGIGEEWLFPLLPARVCERCSTRRTPAVGGVSEYARARHPARS
jgi:hypothetical protein